MFKKYSSAGFTVVEVAVVIPIMLVVIGAFIMTIINFTAQAVDARHGNATATRVQQVLNRIADDVAGSEGFLATNDFTPVSPQGYNDSTTAFNNSPNTLILKMPLTKKNPRTAPAGTDNLVYRANSPLACNNANVASNNLATYNVVYTTRTTPSQSSSIWRRSMMPSGYSGVSYACGGAVWQKPTCSYGYTGTNCAGGQDELNGTTNGQVYLDIKYYEKDIEIPSAETNSDAVASRQQALNRATSVKVTLTTNSDPQYIASRILPLN